MDTTERKTTQPTPKAAIAWLGALQRAQESLGGWDEWDEGEAVDALRHYGFAYTWSHSVTSEDGSVTLLRLQIALYHSGGHSHTIDAIRRIGDASTMADEVSQLRSSLLQDLLLEMPFSPLVPDFTEGHGGMCGP